MSEKFVGGTDRGADAVIPTHELGMAFPQRREGIKDENKPAFS